MEGGLLKNASNFDYVQKFGNFFEIIQNMKWS